MIALARCAGWPIRVLLATGLVVGLTLTSSPCLGHDAAGRPAPGPDPRYGPCPTCRAVGICLHRKLGPGVGTLGYGPPGLHPGFQGFGLGFHPGHGYGGAALGPGVDGGYPFYGGPGYPHPAPRLNRLFGINPFPYYGGPGYPTAECPIYYAAVGQLVADRPVIEIEGAPGEAGDTSGYGSFTGTMPYPEKVFAPFTTSAAAGGTASGVSAVTPGNAPPNLTPAPGEELDEFGLTRYLGAEVRAAGVPDGTRGLEVTKIVPGGLGEKAGLRQGDLIISINGHLTQKSSDVAWIVTNASPDRVLKLDVRGLGQPASHPISIPLP